MFRRGMLFFTLAAMLLVPAQASAQRQVDAGYYHSCAIKLDATPVCWGGNQWGQRVIPAGVGTVTAITVGTGHTCVIKTGGTPACWGLNAFGMAAVPADIGTVTAISAGDQHTCAIKAGGTAVCWGQNSSGQSTIPADLGPVKAIDAGGSATCAIRTDDLVVCWGSNGAQAAQPPAGLKAKTISRGAHHACAVNLLDAPVCWNGATVSQPPAGIGPVKAVTAGGAFGGCAIKTDGTPVCWGTDKDGQTTIPPGTGAVTSISQGHTHTCAVKAADGYVTCWGTFVEGAPVQPGQPNPAPPAAERDNAYSHSFTRSVAFPAATYTLLSGALPPGLSLSASGVLSGTPATNGDYTFAVRTDDGVFTPAGKQFTMTVGVRPAVTANPGDMTVLETGDATFTVAGTGSPAPTVQWSRKGPGDAGFTDIDGATSPTLTLAGVTRAQDGTQVRALLTNTLGQATSTVATLTVNAPIAVTGQPADQIVVEGADAAFAAQAEGYPAPTVQWQRKALGETAFTDIPGATGLTLTLAAVTRAQEGTQVRAAFTNRAGTVHSEPATLTVDLPPSITTQPADQSAREGADATFTVAVGGSPAPSVQWQRKAPGDAGFADIPGATGQTLTLPKVTRAENGTQVRAVLTNRAGTVTSQPATLTVVPVTPLPPTVTPVPPTAPLALGIEGRRTQKVGKKRRLRLALRASAACTVKLAIKVKPRRGKTRKLKVVTVLLAAGKPKTVTVRLPKGLIGTATATATATAGGATVKAKAFKFKLRR